MPDDTELEGTGAGRAIWSGTVSFGLVSVPVNLMPANRHKRVSFRMVTEEGTPLERRYYTTEDEKELSWNQIVRGYEVDKGKYVVLDDEELERLAPEKSRDIDLRLFVPADELDPMYFERGYFLTPAGGSNKGYRLLAAAMEDTGMAGIATFVMRTKEYLVAILAERGILRAETLRFADEVRTAASVGLPKVAKPKPADVKKVATQIHKLEESKLSTKELEDPVEDRVIALAKRKLKKKEDVVRAPKEETGDGADVIDLVAILQQRLHEAEGAARTSKGRGTRKAARKAGAKRAAKKSTRKKATKRAKKSA